MDVIIIGGSAIELSVISDSKCLGLMLSNHTSK